LAVPIKVAARGHLLFSPRIDKYSFKQRYGCG
jgi:hypothetical protein